MLGTAPRFDNERFKKKEIYEGDMTAQALAQRLAKEFSSRCSQTPVQFVQVPTHWEHTETKS